MTIKFLQLNIQHGRFINRIVEFVKENNIDVASFQEVTGGKLSRYNPDCLNYLENKIPNYSNESVTNWKLSTDKNSYFANATFFKKSFELKNKKVAWLKLYEEITDDKTKKTEDYPRTALDITLAKEGQNIKVINTHLAWSISPKDDPNKLRQGKILIDYMQKIKEPFVLSGDFNVDASSKIVKDLDKLAINLTVENGVRNTLNLRTHRAKDVIPKPGLAVDFVYVEKSIQPISFKVIDNLDLSDHLGILAEFEI
ncbi:MAG: endonuclease/exonuclease/phosphatase family protein [Candidatus Levyibacteriota bacterium]